MAHLIFSGGAEGNRTPDLMTGFFLQSDMKEKYLLHAVTHRVTIN